MDKKTEKKRVKIHERIADLENSMKNALQKKSHSGPEINLPKIQKELTELRSQLAKLV
jgi:Tfp pilus assembly protein PilO